MPELRTSIRAETRGMRNVFVVEVVGRKGSAFMIRSTLALARASAHKYAVLLDAPHQVI
jgi:hypothetical protein